MKKESSSKGCLDVFGGLFLFFIVLPIASCGGCLLCGQLSKLYSENKTQQTTEVVENYHQDQDTLEAQELALIFKTKYPIILSVGDQQSKWAKCYDETLGFQNMKNCLQECSQKIDKIKGAILTHQLSPTTQSAIDVNNLFDEFVITNSFLFDDRLKWVQKNEQKLQLLMSNKSLWKTCGSTINCHDEKNSFPSEDDLYAKASWGHISKASEYTSKIFVCGTKENWCSENKVASRLKVNSREACDENIPYCKLLVRATGKEL